MSRQDARRVLVAYDIPDDPRRVKVAQVLARFGDRVQYSVFLVHAGSAGLLRLRSELLRVMDCRADSVLLCDLGLADGSLARIEQLGVGRAVRDAGPFVV